MKLKEMIGKVQNMSTKKKAKFKSAVIMFLVCVLMLSGATYAWFTISNQAKVNSLALQVASEGSLYIALGSDFTTTPTPEDVKNNGTEVDLDMEAVSNVLYPCTTADGVTFYKPEYSASDTVNTLSKISDTEKKLYYYETDLWLLVEETLATGVSNNVYDITLEKNTVDSTGSYVDGTIGSEDSTNTSTADPSWCIRVSFKVDDPKQAATIYAPNSDQHVSSKKTKKAEKKYNNTALPETAATVYEQSSSGIFEGDTQYYIGDSAPLFHITSNTPTKVTVRVWFEGSDDDCVNEIENGIISGTIKFVSHKQAATTTTDGN